MPQLLAESSHVNKYVSQEQPFAETMPRFVIFIMKIRTFCISVYPDLGIFRVVQGIGGGI